MKLCIALVALSVVSFCAVSNAIELPKEVTPAIRAACEKDVRRLCVRRHSTLQSVKACVLNKFKKLNMRCQFKLVQAGM